MSQWEMMEMCTFVIEICIILEEVPLTISKGLVFLALLASLIMGLGFAPCFLFSFDFFATLILVLDLILILSRALIFSPLFICAVLNDYI